LEQVWLLTMNLIQIFSVFLLSLAVAIVSREYLVARLRIADKDLWADLGSPEFLERDYFLEKYPYRGWGRVCRFASYFDKCVLLIFAVSHIACVVLLVAGVGVWFFSE